MSPRTKEQNEEIRLRRLAQIRKAAADVFLNKGPLLEMRDVVRAGGTRLWHGIPLLQQ